MMLCRRIEVNDKHAKQKKYVPGYELAWSTALGTVACLVRAVMVCTHAQCARMLSCLCWVVACGLLVCHLHTHICRHSVVLCLAERLNEVLDLADKELLILQVPCISVPARLRETT